MSKFEKGGWRAAEAVEGGKGEREGSRGWQRLKRRLRRGWQSASKIEKSNVEGSRSWKKAKERVAEGDKD